MKRNEVIETVADILQKMGVRTITHVSASGSSYIEASIETVGGEIFCRVRLANHPRQLSSIINHHAPTIEFVERVPSVSELICRICAKLGIDAPQKYIARYQAIQTRRENAQKLRNVTISGFFLYRENHKVGKQLEKCVERTFEVGPTFRQRDLGKIFTNKHGVRFVVTNVGEKWYIAQKLND